MTGGDGLDNKSRAADRVPGSEYAWATGRKCIRINFERIIRIHFYVTGFGDQRQPCFLANAEDNHVSIDNKFGAFDHIGNPATVIVDVELVDALAFNASHVTTAVISDREEVYRGVQADVFLACANDFFGAGRDSIFRFTHSDLNIVSAQTPSSTRHVHGNIAATYDDNTFSCDIGTRVASRAVELMQANITQKDRVDQDSV